MEEMSVPMIVRIPEVLILVFSSIAAWYVWRYYEPKPPQTPVGALSLILAAVALCLFSLYGSLQVLPTSPVYLIVSPALLIGTLALAVFDR